MIKRMKVIDNTEYTITAFRVTELQQLIPVGSRRYWIGKLSLSRFIFR